MLQDIVRVWLGVLNFTSAWLNNYTTKGAIGTKTKRLQDKLSQRYLIKLKGDQLTSTQLLFSIILYHDSFHYWK